MLTPLLTVEEAARLLKVKPKTVHGFVREGKLASIQLSPRDRRFTEEQLQAFIASRTLPPPKPLDTSATRPSPSIPRSRKGGAVSSEGLLVRALREEMRSWR